uniref:Peptidase metallopeptidase domain-containing protein n=1 Tax=Acrobeloides nanus TaxID=290746 RepID=A0A914C5C2_9BILA
MSSSNRLYLFGYLAFLSIQYIVGNRPAEKYDFVNDVLTQSRYKRYVLSPNKWPYQTLTWQLRNDHITDADRFIIRHTLHRAFNLWASASSLMFIELPVGHQWKPDITVAFLKGKHGDNLPFDGPEGIVAHAFYPAVGVLHFDADENWTLNRFEGINLYQAAVHEIGHLLGLEHSTDTRAVMFPKNRKFDLEYNLADDDIRAIRKLYPLKVERTRMYGYYRH